MSPSTGLRTGTLPSVRVSRTIWARAVLMRWSWRSKPSASLAHGRGDERAADGAAGVGDCHLAEVEAELREHAADAARLGIVGLRQRIDRRVLALLDPIERRLQAGDRSADAAGALGEARWCADRPAFRDRAAARKAPLSLSRDGLSGIVRGSAAPRRRLDRAGGLAEAVQRARARFQRRLPAQNLLELLLVLLLVDQLAA